MFTYELYSGKFPEKKLKEEQNTTNRWITISTTCST